MIIKTTPRSGLTGYMNIFTPGKHIHCIGIKGVGMTALAQLLSRRGVQVTGSDVDEKFFTDAVLAKEGIAVVSFGEADMEGVDAVVYSTAYGDTNVDMQGAKEHDIPRYSYPEAIAQLFNGSQGIAIAGSHGKTTTTALAGYVFSQIGADPTVIVGSNVPQFGGNILVGKSDMMILEADEYQNKLELYQPQHAMVTSIDYDHPDFFPNPEEYEKVFKNFIEKIPGIVVLCIDDAGIEKILPTLSPQGTIITYGSKEGAQYRYTREGTEGVFTITDPSGARHTLKNALIGKHNQENACGVFALIHALKIPYDPQKLEEAFASFQGTERRCQKKGVWQGVVIIDDYAHHPTEIRATLAALREQYPDQRIACVFHAHTFSRTESLFADFAESFKDVDTVLVLDVYGSARESKGTMTSQKLTDAINHHSHNAVSTPTHDDTFQYLITHHDSFDVVVTMGAGDVWKIGDQLLHYAN